LFDQTSFDQMLFDQMSFDQTYFNRALFDQMSVDQTRLFYSPICLRLGRIQLAVLQQRRDAQHPSAPADSNHSQGFTR
jgi:hypothetical protein